MSTPSGYAIKAEQILKLTDADLPQYKLHLASWNGSIQPLDVYLTSWQNWVDWNEWRGNKNDFNRQYIFSLIQFYHEPNKWLFGGIFQVNNRHDDYTDTEVGYDVELCDLHKELIGRLILDFYRYPGMRGRAFLLEGYYKDFTVSEVLKRPFDGVIFPGYDNISIDFSTLEQLIRFQKNDWKTALENVKGVYIIVDKLTGKRYIGSAYGDIGIWSRWSIYANTGHGFNSELRSLIEQHGIEYARGNFRISLLEYRSMRVGDSVILSREAYWKDVILTRGEFGYNRN